MNENLTNQIVAALLLDGTAKANEATLRSAFDTIDWPKEYRFLGVATPALSPGKIFRPSIYVTATVGRYRGFSNQSVDVGQIAVFLSDDGREWTKWIAYDGGNGREDAPRKPKYFTIEATADGTTVYFRQSGYAVEGGIDALTVEVSTDDGASWQEVTAAPAADDVPGAVLATLDAGGKALIRGRNEAYGYYSEGDDDVIENCNFWADKPCYVSGNIMSLVGGEDFAGVLEVQPYAFASMFSDYDVELDWSWVLSREGDPLLLPATTLAQYCYSSMFSGCTGLTEAPALPATTLAQDCYSFMFSGCTGLTSVVCLATDISASGATTAWLQNVAASGTFTKAAGVTWPSGASGIPNGWTVVEA